MENMMIATPIPDYRPTLPAVPPRLPMRSERHDTGERVARLLRCFEPISLAQMDSVALQDRVDTKYVIGIDQLAGTLAALAEHYRVLEINGARLNHYQTLYFDTPEFDLYLRHHDDRPDRYKVRSRRYVESDRSFLEVKHKTPKNRTIKQRIETEQLLTHIPAEADDLMAAPPLDVRCLEPKLWNEFSRMTLVGRFNRERVTLVLDLRFRGAGATIALPGIAIIEIKQNGINRGSPVVRAMRAMRMQPTGFSKYCIGVSRLYPSVKHNSFKPRLRLIEKLQRGQSYGE